MAKACPKGKYIKCTRPPTWSSYEGATPRAHLKLFLHSIHLLLTQQQLAEVFTVLATLDSRRQYAAISTKEAMYV